MTVQNSLPSPSTELVSGSIETFFNTVHFHPITGGLGPIRVYAITENANYHLLQKAYRTHTDQPVKKCYYVIYDNSTIKLPIMTNSKQRKPTKDQS